MSTHKKLEEQVTLSLTFLTLSPLYIGDSDIDAPEKKASENVALRELTKKHINELDNNAPFLIPGSTFRGASLSYLDKLDRQFPQFKLATIISSFFGKMKTKKILEEVSTNSPAMKGRIWFSDVRVPYTDKTVEKKSFTPIEKGTQKPVAPLSLIAISSNTSFTVQLTIMNPTIQEYALLALLLRAYNEKEIVIGGYQTRGLGQVALQSVTCTTTIFGGQKNSQLIEYGDFVETTDKLSAALQIKTYVSQNFNYESLQFAMSSLETEVMV